jgi:hypothetical protein
VARQRLPLVPGLSGRAARLELVRMATLAASSHNTQPWRFVPGDDEIAILPDRTRRCPVVDPDDHHLYASLGAAAENIVQAAPALGLRAAPRYEPDDSRRDDPTPYGGGRIVVALAPGSTETSPLAAAIPLRQCTRHPYDGRAVPPADLAALDTAGRLDGAEAILVTERPAIDAIAALVIEGNTAQLADPAFRAELKRWIRFSHAAAHATGDGLFGACAGNPAIPDALGRAVFDRVLTAEAENRRIRAQVAGSAGLAVFVADRDDPAGWVAAGRAYQRFALQATALGLRHAFLNQPVEVPALRPKLAALVGRSGRRPNLVVRFGTGPALPMSLRRDPADVTA